MTAEAVAVPQHVSEDTILQLGSGFRAAKLLFVVNELGLFEHLASGPGSLRELPAHTGIAEPRLRVLVNAMVALGLLDQQGDEYANAPLAAAFLSGQTATDLRPALRFWNRLSFPVWTNLEHALRSGQGQWRPSASEEDQRIFSEGVEALTASAAQMLATRCDFSQHRRVLDLGGGTGSWLLPMLCRHRHLQATLVEHPGPAAIARDRLAADAATRSVEVVVGNLFSDPIPAGHDVVLLAHVLHGYTPAQNIELLRRVRAAVAEPARVLLVDNWTDASHTHPQLSTLFAAEFLVFLGQGDVYSEDEVYGWLRETGWRPIERTPLSGPQSVVVAEANQG